MQAGFQCFSDRRQLPQGQTADLPFQFRHWNRVDLLKMKHVIRQKWRRNFNFAGIAPQCSCMGHHRNEREFIVRRVIAQNQTRPNLCSHAQINNPNLTGKYGSLHLPVVRPDPFLEMPAQSPPRQAVTLRARLPTPECADISRAFRRAKASAVPSGFRWRSQGNITDFEGKFQHFQ